MEQVRVIKSRNRDKEQFEMNVESIENMGLLKPIRVHDKFLEPCIGNHGQEYVRWMAQGAGGGGLDDEVRR